MKIIDGKELANKVKIEVAKKILSEKFKNITPPHLVVIQVGDNPASNLYINNKKKACESVGIRFSHYQYGEEVTTSYLKEIIQKLSLMPTVTGIMIQLPLPKHINERELIDAIDPMKDVDGFTSVQAGMLQLGMKDDNRLLPCTAKGIIRLLETVTTLEGKHAVVVGRSNIVGKPVAQLLQEKNATVTLCHSKTKNLDKIISTCDIVIFATGIPKHFGYRYFYNNKEVIIIDAGICRDENGKLCGDLNVEDMELGKYVTNNYYTPVPGGVGPMTVAELVDNVYLAYENQFDFIWKYCNNRQIFQEQLAAKTKSKKDNKISIELSDDVHVLTVIYSYKIAVQILPNIDKSAKNIICFPDSIKGVSMQFIEELLKLLKMNKQDFYKYFSVEGNDEVINKFYDTLRFID